MLVIFFLFLGLTANFCENKVFIGPKVISHRFANLLLSFHCPISVKAKLSLVQRKFHACCDAIRGEIVASFMTSLLIVCRSLHL